MELKRLRDGGPAACDSRALHEEEAQRVERGRAAHADDARRQRHEHACELAPLARREHLTAHARERQHGAHAGGVAALAAARCRSARR